MDQQQKIYLTGHKGMLGSSILSVMKEYGFSNIVTSTRGELDLTNQASVNAFIEEQKPKTVIHVAGRVGGIAANIKYPGEFLYENLMIQTNVIHAAKVSGVSKVLLVGTSCMYPRECQQPMKEEYLLTGRLEPTNEGYAIAKIAGLKMLEMYNRSFGLQGVSVIPCNLYGPDDTFDLERAHVLSSLVKRFVDAKFGNQESITLWGTGSARREFLHTRDCAKGILHILGASEEFDVVNIGPGDDISIKDLATLIATKVGFTGDILWDPSKPDGMPRKCMDVSRMSAYGFKPMTSLEDGVVEVIESYIKSYYANTFNA